MNVDRLVWFVAAVALPIFCESKWINGEIDDLDVLVVEEEEDAGVDVDVDADDADISVESSTKSFSKLGHL